MKNQKRGFAQFIFLAIGVLVLLGAVLTSIALVNKNFGQKQGQKEVPVVRSVNEIKDWKKYINNNGFKFEVPSDWVVTDGTVASNGFVPYSTINSSDYSFKDLTNGQNEAGAVYEVHGVGITVNTQRDNPNIKTVADLQNFAHAGRGGSPSVNEKIINTAGEPAFTFDINSSDVYKSHHLQFAHDNLWIYLSLAYGISNYDDKQIFDHIVSTFKFTK